MANEEQNFAELYENSLKSLEEGTQVTGTVVNVVGDEIFVDLGYKADGIVPREEFSYNEDDKPADKYKAGDKIDVFILKMNDGKGNVLLSTKRLQTKKLREEFEANPNFATEYLRPNNDNVHFTKAGAQYVAGRVWDIAKEFKL